MTDRYIFYDVDGKNLKVPVERQKEFEERLPEAKMMLTFDGKNHKIPISQISSVVDRIGADNLTYSVFDEKKEYVPSLSTNKLYSFDEPKDSLASFPTTPNTNGYEDRPNVGETFLKGIGAGLVRAGKAGLDLGNLAFKTSTIGYPIDLIRRAINKEHGNMDEELQDTSNPITRASIKLGEVADRLSREADPTGGEKGFVDLISEGKYGMAFQKALGSGLESLPMMVSASTGVGALIYGAGMAASTYSDETRENPDIPSWKRGVNALGSAALEMAVERIGGPLKNVFGKAGGELTDEMAKELLENVAKEGTESIAKRIAKGLKNIGKEGLEEGGEELLTSFGNDALGEALDIIDGDKDYGIRAQWERIKEENPDASVGDFAKIKAKEYLDSFIGGALSGMQISSAAGAINYAVKNEDIAKLEINKSRELGAALNYGDMYDTDEVVNESIDKVGQSFINKDGEQTLSREFILSLSSDQAYELARREDVPAEQRSAFYGLAKAKALQEGLNSKLDQRLNEEIEADRTIINNASENGKILTADYGGKLVYVKGGAINKNKTTLPNGGDGPIIVIDSVTGEQQTVNTKDLGASEYLDTDKLISLHERSFRDSEGKLREEARNTMSSRAKTKAVLPYARKKILIDVGNGITEVFVEKISDKGEVMIKGKKGDLGGQSILTMDASTFYDSIYRDDDGNPVVTEVEQENEEVTEPTEETPETELTGEEDFRDYTGNILINGVPVNVEVTAQDNPSNTITYRYTDENGYVKTGSTTIGEFKTAVQQAEEYASAQIETPEPVVNDPAPVTEEPAPEETTEETDWDALFEKDLIAFYDELRKQFGDGAIDFLNMEISATEKEIDSLEKNMGKSMNERVQNLSKLGKLRNKRGILYDMLTKLQNDANPTVETPTDTTESPTETPSEPADETPVEPIVAAPVEGTPVTEVPADGKSESGFIIVDKVITNPEVIEMPNTPEGDANRIFIGEYNGKWTYGAEALMDNGSWGKTPEMRIENARYDTREDAIKAAISFLENQWRNKRKDAGSTALDSFIQYVRDTYLPSETPAQATPIVESEPVAEPVPAQNEGVQTGEQIGQEPEPTPEPQPTTSTKKGGAIVRLFGEAKRQIDKIASKAGIKDFVATDSTRPALTGVYREGGYEYASDQMVLAKIKATYPADQEGKLISPKTGQEINQRHPNYELVVNDALNGDTLSIDIDDIIAYAQTLEDVKKGMVKDARLSVKVGNSIFMSDMLLTAARMAKKHGLTTIVQKNTPGRAMAFTGENGTVLVMPRTMLTGSTLNMSDGTVEFNSDTLYQIKVPTTLKGIEAAKNTLEAILPNLDQIALGSMKNNGSIKLVDGKVVFEGFAPADIIKARDKAKDPNTYNALDSLYKDGLVIPLSEEEVATIFPDSITPTIEPVDTIPTAPTPVDDPIREAQKREKSLATQLKRIGISREQKQDMAFNAGKAVADMFATRDEYDAYAENATDFGEFNEDFDMGVDASFANRSQSTGNSPVNSVPLETEPNGEENGETAKNLSGGVREGYTNTNGNEPNNDEKAEDSFEESGEGSEEVSGSGNNQSRLVSDKYPVRNGDITRQTLADTFGLNSVSPALNQDVLNSIYDFMMEMSKMLGISPKSIGHGATLGVKTLNGNSTSRAQYSFKLQSDGTIIEPYLRFKNARLSSIAHEWFHSLDQALSYYETGRGKRSATNVISGEFTGRQETLDAIKGIIKAINNSGHKERLKKELWYNKSYLRYSLKKDEMSARAFEEYIRMKFADAGIEVSGLSENATNHPTPEEMVVIAPAFDNLFKVLQEKDGKKPGTSVLYHIGEQMEPQSDAKKLATEAVFMSLDEGGREVEILSDEQTEQYLKMIGADTETQFSVDADKPIFLSNAAIAVAGIKQEKATPEQWLKMIEKVGGLKAGEDKWMGLSDWLKESDKKTLTKQEVLDFINDNTIRIEEQQYVADIDYSEDEQAQIDAINEEFIALRKESEEAGEWIHDAAEIAYQIMADKYGDDFTIGFGVNMGKLYVSNLEAASSITGIEPRSERLINDTRLRYTTEGLDNKKEIAIIIPTIDKWNQYDEIHFGDAGDGRAVAWVRFGDAKKVVSFNEPIVVEEFKEPYKNFRGWDVYKPVNDVGTGDYITAGTMKDTGRFVYATFINDKVIGFYETFDEAKSAMNQHYAENPKKKFTKKKILVIDEIQSKRHQEGRERGYKSPRPTKETERLKALNAKMSELREQQAHLNDEIAREKESEDIELAKIDARLDDVINIGQYNELSRMRENIERKRSMREDALYVIKNEIMHTQSVIWDEEGKISRAQIQWIEDNKDKISDAPFDKNWHELAMKRMLRYAAENGYDAIAWTKGEQQAERYSLAKRFTSIEREDNPSINGRRFKFYGGNVETFIVNDVGVVIDSTINDAKGKSLTDVVGKNLAIKMMSIEDGDTLDNQDISVGGEGMMGFYDKMLPAFMNKYGKKWSIKVEDIKLNGLEDGEINMHSVPVNDAMRKSVMEGQPMFFKTPNGTVYGWTDGKKIYLTKAGINPNTPIHEYTHLWAKAMMLRNPKGWQSIKELLKGTPVWNEVMNDANYSNIHSNEDLVASEALSRISGSENAAKLEQMAQQMIDEAKGTMRKLEARGLIQRIKDALNEFWNWVGVELFGIESFESVEQVTDRVLWDLMNATDLGELSEGQVETQIVTDPKVIAELEASPKRTGYRNVVQNEDGTFSSPMAYWLQSTKEGAKSRVETAKFELGKWEEAEEHPELVDDKGHVTLVKPNKSTVEVAYDPYIHNRLDPVNLQFKDAWKRDELVYVETEVPETDLESGYHADEALLSVGVHSWSNGDLMLSRYDKPVRIMPWEDVADAWVERLNGEGVHFDVVPPALRPLLVERGVEILPPHKGMGKDCIDAYDEWKNSNSENNSVSLPNVSQAIESGVWNKEALNELNNIVEDVEEGKAILKRYTSSELTGLLEGGRLLVGASIISRGSEGNVSSSRGRTASLEEKAAETIPAIESWAKEIGVWRDYSERSEEEIAHSYWTSGGEAQVFYLGNGKVEKIIGLDYFVDPQLAIDRIAIHNSLFEETQLRVTGFGTNKDGKFAIIVEQPTIIGKHTDNAEIDSYIKSIGFKKIDDATRTFANEELYLSDLHEENVLNQEHKRYYVIDGDFRLNTPEAGIGGTRHIDDGIIRDNNDIRYRRSDIQNAAVDYNVGETRNSIIERAVSEEAQKLGVNVTFAKRSEMAKGHETDKGYYNTKTGEIVVCPENNASIADAIQTILHEAVAHKGLRALMGDKFNEFINRVYDSLDAETKAKVDALAESKYNGNTAIAMEEYMASLAETMEFENNSVWDKIKSIFNDIINAILGRNDIKIGDNELRYILRASYNNMTNPRNMETVRGWAQDQMMREEYKINEASPELLSRTGVTPDDVARETARGTYDRVVNDNWQEFQRQFQDAMQPVRIAIDAIQQETGNIPIEDYENYILIQNHASSRSRVEIDEFARKYYSPIIKQINGIIDAMLEARGFNIHNKAQRSKAYQELKNYLIAKHGLERNEYYQTHKQRLLNAKEKEEAIREIEDNYSAELARIASTYRGTERANQENIAKQRYESELAGVDSMTTFDVRDYAGLTALYGLDPKEFELAESMARETISSFEAGIDTYELWRAINAATDKTLRHSYECGMLSRQQYEDIKNMFSFYIPLRRFDETTAEDVYSYARFEGNRFNPAVQTAKGRTSLADDPIAIIMNMAESEIAQGNKNRAKQALYNFILNRPVVDENGNQSQNSLMQIESVWYVKNVDAQGNETYTIAAPDHANGETYEDFEARMQTLANNDMAFKSKKGKVDVGMRFQKQMDRNSHYIYLKVNGVDKAIYINGDPKAADAVNGTYQQKKQFGEDKMRTLNRLISSTFTNYSLEFTARNYFRDMFYSHINIGVRESDPAYRKKFRQNWRHNNLGTMMKMLTAYRAGEFDGRPLTEDEVAFVEFMKNGGQTGYTLINSVENHKRDLERAIKNMQKGIEHGGVKDSTIFKYTLGGVELLNEASELVTRFAAFKTSRDMGRGVETSINDAKEVTVNFNTKGAQDGAGWMGAVARYFGWSKFFFNASVQGVQNIKAMSKANTLKFCGVVGGVAAAGFFMPIISSVISEILGGDDDDENFYWNIPEYERQNNLCIPVGSRYVKIPLPIGFREVYAIGDMVAAMLDDKKFDRDISQIGTDIANKIASVILPINPLESAANGLDLWQTGAYTILPSGAQFAIQNMTNIDWKGAPLQKEYTWNKDDPQWMKAFNSNPDWLTGLSRWCNEHINIDGDFDGMDWSPEKIDNTLSNLFGGIYSLLKKSGKTISMIWNEENRNLSNVPLTGVVLGSSIDNDDRFIESAYYEMNDYYDANVNSIKRTGKAFGYSLEEIFEKQPGAHQPKMQKIYSNDNFDFMQEWYKGDKALESLKGKINRLEKKAAGMDNPTVDLLEEIANLKNEYEADRRDFVNDMLELD